MSSPNPLSKTKEEYQEILDKISSKESAVGIDAQYTHAVIISYLENLNQRLEKIEKILIKPN